MKKALKLITLFLSILMLGVPVSAILGQDDGRDPAEHQRASSSSGSRLTDDPLTVPATRITQYNYGHFGQMGIQISDINNGYALVPNYSVTLTTGDGPTTRRIVTVTPGSTYTQLGLEGPQVTFTGDVTITRTASDLTTPFDWTDGYWNNGAARYVEKNKPDRPISAFLLPDISAVKILYTLGSTVSLNGGSYAITRTKENAGVSFIAHFIDESNHVTDGAGVTLFTSDRGTCCALNVNYVAGRGPCPGDFATFPGLGFRCVVEVYSTESGWTLLLDGETEDVRYANTPVYFGLPYASLGAVQWSMNSWKKGWNAWESGPDAYESQHFFVPNFELEQYAVGKEITIPTGAKAEVANTYLDRQGPRGFYYVNLLHPVDVTSLVS